MNAQKKKDLQSGFKSEIDIHEKLETIFGDLLYTSDNETMGMYYPFDKYNDKFFIELKTRNIIHTQYPTLMFGQNKYNEGCRLITENPKLRIFYLWRCNDGIYYWEHNSSEHSIQYSGRRDRGKVEMANLVHIKQCDIKNLDELEL